MRGTWLLEIEFKVEPHRLADFNSDLTALRKLSSRSSQREAIFEDKTDATSFLWMAEWASRDLLTDFVHQEGVRTTLERIAACDLLAGCRLVEEDKTASPLKRTRRGIRQVSGQTFDLPGFGGASPSKTGHEPDLRVISRRTRPP